MWDQKSFSDGNDRAERDVKNSTISNDFNHSLKSWSCCNNRLIVFATINKKINNVNNNSHRKRKLNIISSHCNDHDNYDDDHDDTVSKVAITLNVIEIPTLFDGHFMLCHDKYTGDKNNSSGGSSGSYSANNSNILVDGDSNIISICPHHNMNSVSIILTSSIKNTSTSSTTYSTSTNTTFTTEVSTNIEKKMIKVSKTTISKNSNHDDYHHNDHLNISSRWIKISLDSNKEILLQRKLFYNNQDYHPINCTTILNQIVMISKENIILCYDSRYGTLLQSYDNHHNHLHLQQQVTTTTITSSISNTSSNIKKTSVDSNHIQNGWIVVQSKDEDDDDGHDHHHPTTTASSSSNNNSNVLRLFTSNYNHHNLTYSLHQYHLNIVNQITHTTLANSIGRLKSSSSVSSSTPPPPPSGKASSSSSSSSSITVLNNNFVKSDTNNDVTKNNKQIINNSNESNKNSKGDDNDDDAEWDMMNELLRSRSISILSQPSLIARAAVHHRIDTLALIVEYGIDLSEKSCMKILYYIMMLPIDISVSDCSYDDSRGC